MKGRFIPVLIAILATPAFAADRHFQVAGEVFGDADILDARAQPELDGTSSIRITFNESAAKRIAAVTMKLVGKPAHVALDNETVADPIVREPIRDSSAPWRQNSGITN